MEIGTQMNDPLDENWRLIYGLQNFARYCIMEICGTLKIKGNRK